jgi:hypothetical protein
MTPLHDNFYIITLPLLLADLEIYINLLLLLYGDLEINITLPLFLDDF